MKDLLSPAIMVQNLTPHKIAERLQGVAFDADTPALTTGPLVESAVIMPLLHTDKGWQVLFIRRSDKVRFHKGQIAFPGGRKEVEDLTILDTALRETQEEVGLEVRPTQVLGRLPVVVTGSTGFLIHPFVASLTEPLDFIIESREVAEVILLPLAFFFEYKHDSFPERFVSGKHTIWGATARIVNQFVLRMQRWDGL